MGKFLACCADQLRLHVRHRAWLAAKPEKEKRSRLDRFEAEERSGVERRQLELPPLDYGGHLVDYLFAVGPSCGGEVLSFGEITAWTQRTGVRLDAWESETLRSLSNAYLAELHEAVDPERPSPGSPQQLTDDERARVASAREKYFDQLMGEKDPAPAVAAAPEKVNRRTSVIRRAPAQSDPTPDGPAKPTRVRSQARSRPE